MSQLLSWLIALEILENSQKNVSALEIPSRCFFVISEIFKKASPQKIYSKNSQTSH